jgi:hypothetical protein
MIELKTINNLEFIRLIKNSPKRIQSSLRAGMYLSGKELKKELVKELNKKGRSGIVYKIYRGIGGRRLVKARKHRASTKSEFPAKISGDYRSSIDFLTRGITRLEFGSGANNKATDYAEYLEKRNQPVGKISKRLQNKVKIIILKKLDKAIKEF